MVDKPDPTGFDRLGDTPNKPDRSDTHRVKLEV